MLLIPRERSKDFETTASTFSTSAWNPLRENLHEGFHENLHDEPS